MGKWEELPDDELRYGEVISATKLQQTAAKMAGLDVKPPQYQIGIDTFERMKANCTFDEIVGACKLNIDKYIWRKKGTDKQDLQKAKDYIDLWIWAIENKG